MELEMLNNTDFELDNHLPLIAILRGIKPQDVIRVAEILISEGYSMIEVPLNSPNAIESIELLSSAYNKRCFVGAGTVTSPALVKDVISAGANLVVTPNLNEEVIKRSLEAKCIVFPGIATPTEAFSALAMGATGIKLFPVSILGLDGFKALQAVIPEETICMPVGGIEPTTTSMKPLLDIGAKGFGLGSSLYKPGMSDETIRQNARAYVDAFHLAKQ